MESLIRLVGSLKKGEVQLVKHFYSFKSSPERKKRDRLFQSVLDHKVASDGDAVKLLYKQPSATAFSQLKARLKSDILNVLLLQESTVKYKTLYAQATFNCRRDLIKGEILLSRGVYEEAIRILRKASKLAVKYELFAEQILLDDLLRNHLVMTIGHKPFETHSKSIDDTVVKLDKLLKAKYQHYMHTVPHLFKVTNQGRSFEHREKVLEKVKEDFDATGSARLGFYYYLTALHHYLQVKDFKQSLIHATLLLKLVEDNSVVSSKANIAGVNMELAGIYISLGQNGKAIKHAKKGLAFFTPGMLNQLYALEKLFFAYYRGNDSERANDIVKQAIKHKQLQGNSFFVGKWLLLRSALQFKEGNFKQSLTTLRKNTSIMADKSGWLRGYCILEILNRVELGDCDGLEYRYDAFKKIVYRHGGKAKDDGNDRWKVILTILKTLINHNYNFKETIDREAANLELLEQTSGGYHWDPAGYEIVRFDLWLKQKVEFKHEGAALEKA